MDRRGFLKATSAAAGLATLFSCSRATGLPRSMRTCYRPGNQVDPDIFFLDNRLERVTLGGQVNDLTRIVYLFIFDGAYAKKPPDKRGGLWCVDTVDDMPIHRTVFLNYADKGVTFVPVAAPPVHSGDRYGYPKDVFLTEREDSARYRSAVAELIEKTEALKEDGTLPFDPIFYDARFRLLDNPAEHEHVEAYGQVYPWQGRFKWHEDEQTYGTPTLWLLDRSLRVVREPFFGNVYEEVPLHIRYTVRDVVEALDRALGASESRS